MKKVLITGSNGLLGQKLIATLVQRNTISPTWEIHATSKGENRYTQTAGYSYHALDITNEAEVQKIVTALQPDIVINTAAMTNVDQCESEREGALKLNVKAVEYLISAISKLPESKQRQLIHLSTDFIFDGENGPYREEDAPNPLSYYAETKLQAEELVKKCEFPWAIVRTIIVYGVADAMSRSNIVLWAKDALGKGQALNIVDDQFRSPTLAEDLAEGCVLIAEQKATGIYHISGKDFMSVLELVQRVARFWKLDESLITPSKSATIKQPAKRPPRTGFILDKAIRELKYNPHSFEEGLAVLDAQLKSRHS